MSDFERELRRTMRRRLDRVEGGEPDYGSLGERAVGALRRRRVTQTVNATAVLTSLAVLISTFVLSDRSRPVGPASHPSPVPAAELDCAGGPSTGASMDRVGPDPDAPATAEGAVLAWTRSLPRLKLKLRDFHAVEAHFPRSRRFQARVNGRVQVDVHVTRSGDGWTLDTFDICHSIWTREPPAPKAEDQEIPLRAPEDPSLPR